MTKVRIGSRGSHSGKTIEYITAAETLALDDSGKVFTLDSSGGAYSITLPTALQGGLHYTFIVEENTPTADITIAAGSAIIYGNLDIQSDTNEDNRVACNGKSNILFDTTCLKGDWLEMVCDGSAWHARGFSQIQGGFTTS